MPIPRVETRINLVSAIKYAETNPTSSGQSSSGLATYPFDTALERYSQGHNDGQWQTLHLLDFIYNYKMQATLAFTARPLAVRRATAQTSRRNAIVVRAEKKEVTRYVFGTLLSINSCQCGRIWCISPEFWSSDCTTCEGIHITRRLHKTSWDVWSISIGCIMVSIYLS